MHKLLNSVALLRNNFITVSVSKRRLFSTFAWKPSVLFVSEALWLFITYLPTNKHFELA